MRRLFSIFPKPRVFTALFFASLGLFLWIGSLTVPLNFALEGRAAIAQTEVTQQVQQGIERYQAQDYGGAIALWQQALKSAKPNPSHHTAIIQENLARAYQQRGQFDRAIAYWQPPIDYYRQIGDLAPIGRLLTEQAQAYLYLGQLRPAIALLCGAGSPPSTKPEPPSAHLDCQVGTALQIARQQNDRPAEVAALGSLGEAYRLQGHNERAITYLQQAQAIAPDHYAFAISNSLGNTYAAIAQRQTLIAASARQRGIEPSAKLRVRRFENEAQDNAQKARQAFQASLKTAMQQDNLQGEMRSLLNLIALSSRFPSIDLSRDRAIDRAVELWDRLPASPDKVYGAIELASLPVAKERLTTPLAQCPSQRYLSNHRAQTLLDQSIILARTLQNSRVESFALGALGHFYECQQQYAQALQLTQEALQVTATSLSDRDSAYLWEWQQGRIFQNEALQQQDKTTEAPKADQIAAFQRAYALLEDIRGDILGSERDIQFDFRDAIEPIYRQLAQLRLKLVTQTVLDRPTQEQELTLALETIDSLRLAELQNYFGSDCLDALVSDNSLEPSIKGQTAVFSTIILDDSTAILLSLPNGEKKVHWVDHNRATVEQAIKIFWEGLVRGVEDSGSYDLAQSQKLYDWLIRDFESDLASANIKTLVFIQDGLLRTIPMAALHDGNAYLVEKYAIAMTPSLRAIYPKKSNLKDKAALILGVTQETEIDGQEFSALLGVPLEIDKVQAQFPRHQSLIDNHFDRETLNQELDRSTYPIIHIATHAQFGFVPEDTFLVAGNSNKITLDQFEAALRTVNGGANAIALLTLSACQTAAGDERAALGLAGVALQTGVQSALASLWSVEDASTVQLVTEFYRGLLQSGVSKAEALRLAQIKLIRAGENADIDNRYDNPAYWSPFILIGNWL